MGRIAMNKEYVPEWDQPATRTEESTANKNAASGVKQIVTIRLDVDMLEWFKSAGPGYQTRINQVLREYMEANRVRAQVEQH
ncbi:BrnA antitoxin family protein [Massilia sp. 2TAF26]